MTTSSSWDPQLYARFQAERSRPFYDLAALVQPRPALRVVDLGCGSGELTAWLHHELGAATTLGIDNSETMLERARDQQHDGLSFERADIASFEPAERFDLVFSNAAVHWVPDHPALFTRLAALLEPGGQLAVQMPCNWQHPSHVLAAELASEEPYATALEGYTTQQTEANVLTPSAYAELLYELGFEEQHVRLQVYPVVLPGAEAVLEWVSGTLLTAYRSRLDAPLYASYFEEYSGRLMPALGDRRPFLYPYPRILIWGLHST
jgi:trans-aconitate 2-methyltransferase